MSNYVLSCCTTADLNKDYFEKRNIAYVCMRYSIGGKAYADDLGQTIPYDEFYKRMAEGEETKTSQVNVAQFIEFFTPFLEEGKDIFHLAFSSGLSGTYNSANIAKAELEEKFPERRIVIVDSLAASSGHGLFVDALADKRDEGATIDELYEFAMEKRLHVNHWFFSTDLTFYVRGGRISKASGWFGTLLKICPLLNMNNEGKLIPRIKCRGKANVINEIVKQMEAHAEGGTEYSGKVFISHSACLEDAQAVADLIKEKFPNINGEIMMNSIGTVVGAHTGPGTVALFFFGDERAE